MSTDRKRLTSAIQRIAREDPEIRELLKDFRNSGGKPSETATSGSGAEDRQTCCDGSSSGNANPGSDTRDPSDGGQDASDGLGDDPAKLENGPGTLSGVKDCVTNEPICFEGDDWLPPEGWESPTDPPTDPTYEPDFYWEVRRYGVGYGKYPTASGASASFVNAITGGEGSCSYTGDGRWDCSDGPIQTILDAYLSQFGCPDESTASHCNPSEDDIKEKYWPEDGCVNLAQKRGKLVASKYDPENDGSYSKPRDSIELCDDFGNSFELSPSASGGWKTISAQNPGDGYLYNSSGEQIARISGSEYSDPSV